MDRRAFIKRAGSSGVGVAAAAGLAAPAIAQSMPKLSWRCTSSSRRRSTPSSAGPRRWRASFAKSTDGNFDIQIFAAGEIVPGLQAADAVAAGTVELCHTASYYYWGKDPTYALATAVPFMFNDRQMNAWLYYGGGNQLLNDYFATHSSTPCPAAIRAPRWAAGTARRSTPSPTQRPQDADRRLRRQGAGAARARAAADRRRRHLSGAGEGNDRRRGVGRPL